MKDKDYCIVWRTCRKGCDVYKDIDGELNRSRMNKNCPLKTHARYWIPSLEDGSLF